MRVMEIAQCAEVGREKQPQPLTGSCRAMGHHHCLKNQSQISSWVVCHCCLSRIERAIERVSGWIVEVGEEQSVDGGVVMVEPWRRRGQLELRAAATKGGDGCLGGVAPASPCDHEWIPRQQKPLKRQPPTCL